MGKTVDVIKATGEVEPFAEEKVINSLLRAGASAELAQKIVSQVKPHLYPNIPTFEIYALVMKRLKKEQRGLAEKYNLKRAIMELGPSGYPFEKYVAEVLKVQNYRVQINQLVTGKCVAHEIDIIAKNDKAYMIECKFHGQVGGRTDVKVALYTYARFLDVKNKGFDIPWLITNTKLTQEARAYALCVGMRVTSWDYPEEESLRKMIDKSQLHPITASTILSTQQKQALLEKGVVFCHQSETNIGK
ncbi:MAG TPA: ATP cone domain-containing protein [Patescibacteria group bacterium]|nr:ATP cone domain-containing protein [Patescibacteria group bacterium]